MTLSFQDTQNALAAWLRDPDNRPAPPGIEQRRLNIYRDLVYNNIEGFLRNGFPALHSLLEASLWHQLARDFIARHACDSPYFVDISRHFVEFLQASEGWLARLPPWALELAHYEWMEVAVDIADAGDWQAGADADGDLLVGAPVLSPVACLLGYRWPVHQLCADYLPASPPEETTWLMVYRDRQDVVKFMALNQAAAALLQRATSNPQQIGHELLSMLARDMDLPLPQVQGFGLALLEQLRERGIVLGARMPGN
ncbi:MAG: putative DNA-binding domain-containing protein [Alcanivoracaceae bacterium]|nr:putative DNA-binding domain-containing protein [Alcanivoracaceae bacterium]